MPPTLFVVLAAPFWKLAHTVFYWDWYVATAVFCGGIFGYVCYDCTHYFLHHKKYVTKRTRLFSFVLTLAKYPNSLPPRAEVLSYCPSLERYRERLWGHQQILGSRFRDGIGNACTQAHQSFMSSLPIQQGNMLFCGAGVTDLRLSHKLC